MKTKFIITGLAFLAITTVAAAQNNRIPPRQNNCTGKGVEYIDADKNGICDNYENSVASASQGKRRAKGNCGGLRQGRGMGQGQGRKANFGDTDRNGIRDSNEAPAKK
jgi:hypothetical protein